LSSSNKFNAGKAEKYLILKSDVYLKVLEKPIIYITTDDSLYEIDGIALDFLKQCDGSKQLFELNPPEDVLDYLLEENIVTLSDLPQTRETTPGINTSPSLRYLLVEVTSRCNLACKHCYQGVQEFRDLDLNVFSGVVDDFESMGGLRLIVSGGEPLMHPAFKGINELVADRAFRSILLTNGTLINEEIAGEIKFNEVQMSLDGLEKGHDYIRGKGSFKKSTAALELIRERGIQISIASMIHAKNCDEFSDLAELVEDLGAASWSIDVPSKTGRLEEFDEIIPPLDQVGPILKMQFGSEIHDSDTDLICGAHLGCVQSSGIFTKCGFYDEWSGGHISKGLKKCWLDLPRMKLSELDCDCDFIQECRGGCRYRAECYNGKKGADPIKCLLYEA